MGPHDRPSRLRTGRPPINMPTTPKWKQNSEPLVQNWKKHNSSWKKTSTTQLWTTQNYNSAPASMGSLSRYGGLHHPLGRPDRSNSQQQAVLQDPTGTGASSGPRRGGTDRNRSHSSQIQTIQAVSSKPGSLTRLSRNAPLPTAELEIPNPYTPPSHPSTTQSHPLVTGVQSLRPDALPTRPQKP